MSLNPLFVWKRSLAIASAAAHLLLASCSNPVEPNIALEPFNTVKPNGLTAVATAAFGQTSTGVELILRVTFTNSSTEEVHLVLRGGSCIVLPLVYSRSDLSGPLIWNGLDVNCPDIGHFLVVGAGGSASIENRLRAPSSVIAAADRGAAHVSAVLSPNGYPLLKLDAGALQTTVPD